MANELVRFERIVRRASEVTDERSEPAGGSHPFDSRNIHPALPELVRRMFDDGYFAQATFEAFKFVEKEVQRHSSKGDSGYKLMMSVFSEGSASIRLTELKTTSQQDEQKGFQFIFAGSVLAIRNPRGHEVAIDDSPDETLDHLALASMLLRRLEQAGYRCESRR